MFNQIRRCFLLVSILATFSAHAAIATAFRVGIVLDKGGRDDKSFNAAAVRGGEDARRVLGSKIDLKIVEATDDNSYEPLLRSLASKGYDLIMAIGVSQQEALKKVAKQFPNQKFAIVDAEVTLPNVRTLMFNEHEGSYLVGALAAMKTKTGKIGFIGGMEIPLIKRFEEGFKAGVKYINPKATVLVNYVGISVEAWNNPPRGKEIALAQIKNQADVIFAPAGGSAMGVYDAVEEKKILAIGVDSNQNFVKPGFILTSMLKRVDVAVEKTIQEGVAGTFSAGTTYFGLANSGIDYALDQYNKPLLTAQELAKLEDLKKKILARKIHVPDFYKNERN